MNPRTTRLVSVACLLGVLSGTLMGDGTFINFRGEEVRRAIERLEEDAPA